MNIIWFLLIGLVAGWLAGQLMKGRGFGIVGNMIVGVVGAVLGGFLFGMLRLVAQFQFMCTVAISLGFAARGLQCIS